MKEHAWLTSLLVLVTFVPTAHATTADCVIASGQHHSDTVREIRVNTSSFSGISGGTISSAEIIQAVNAAIDTWNSTANGSEYRYGGTTTETDADCINEFSVVAGVSVAPGSGNPIGLNTAQCGSPRGQQFRVRIYLTNKTTGMPFNYFVGDPAGATGLDLISNITHEIGHANNINHPNNAFGTMATGAVAE